LESHEVIVVEALKQAKDEHVQKLMEAYLVTFWGYASSPKIL
jgi:hypothetical protein